MDEQRQQLAAFLMGEKDRRPYDKTLEKGMLWPVVKSGYTGKPEWSTEGGIIGSAIDAFTLPGRVYNGEVAPDDPGEMLNFVGNVMGGGGMAARPRGSIGMGVKAARDISSIGPNDPHPGSILAYHATPADFDRFKIGNDIGIHFGSAEQASTRMGQSYGYDGARTIPVELRINNVATVPYDPNDWANPSAIARALDQNNPGLKGFGTRVRSAYDDAISSAQKDPDTFTDPAKTSQGMFYTNAVAAREQGNPPSKFVTNWEAEAKRRADLGMSDEEVKMADDIASLWRALHKQHEKTGSFEMSVETARRSQQEAARSELINAGYDGIRYPNSYEGDGWSYAAIKPGTVYNALTGDLMYSNAPRPGVPIAATQAINQNDEAQKRELAIMLMSGGQ